MLMVLCSLNSCDKQVQQSKKLKMKLVMAIDMVRHGDRAPLIWSPNLMKGIWTEKEMGQLTKKGAIESEEVGKNFKQYYVDNLQFLSSTASPESVYVRSTNYPRTKDTAKAILKGMFGDSSKNLTVEAKEKKDDPVFAPFYKYKSFHEKIDKTLLKNSPKSFAEKLKSGASYINKRHGTSYLNLYDLVEMSNIIDVGRIHKKPLPQNVTKSEADELTSLSDQTYLYIPSIPARNCFNARDSMEEVAGFLENKSNNKIKYKYILLTLHDINITAALKFLGHNITKRPKYNANIRFELLKLGDESFIRTKFDQKTIKVCQQELCSFDEFKQLIANNIVNQCSDFNVNQDYLKTVGII